jgi:hypothetical protein
MPAGIANASRRWQLGKIEHQRKRAADRALVAKFLSTPNANARFFGLVV